jgi:formate hydrogenlyase subunit 6/NADH:ubiquinone oxidoreductase subunit I
MKDFRYLPGRSSLKLDAGACVGCGMCQAVCPHQVLEVGEDKGAGARIVDFDACMECGACQANCPADAVSVTPGVGCAAYIIATWLGRADRAKYCC